MPPSPPVKLSDIVDALELAADESECYLDRQTGRVEWIDEDTRWALRQDGDDADLPEWQRPIVAIAG